MKYLKSILLTLSLLMSISNFANACDNPEVDNSRAQRLSFLGQRRPNLLGQERPRLLGQNPRFSDSGFTVTTLEDGSTVHCPNHLTSSLASLPPELQALMSGTVPNGGPVTSQQIVNIPGGTSTTRFSHEIQQIDGCISQSTVIKGEALSHTSSSSSNFSLGGLPKK